MHESKGGREGKEKGLSRIESLINDQKLFFFFIFVLKRIPTSKYSTTKTIDPRSALELRSDISLFGRDLPTPLRCPTSILSAFLAKTHHRASD